MHNAFRRGVQAFGEEVENLCIHLIYFFKLSPSRREDFAEIQQELGLDEVVFLQHVESRWLSLLPAVERVKEQFPALLEYFSKLPEVDKKIKANDKYKRIISILTSAEIIVQLYFLQDVKPAFDRFLEVF